MLIAVIGGNRDSADPDALALAYQVGSELAKQGVVLVCGGLEGVMEAACKGANANGGTTVGILPGSDPADANPYVDIPICTGMGYARNVIVVKSGQAVIAIDGAFGTLSEIGSEIGHALGDNIPVIGLNTWVLARNGRQDSSIILASDPVDAVEKALRAAQVGERAAPAEGLP